MRWDESLSMQVDASFGFSSVPHWSIILTLCITWYHNWPFKCLTRIDHQHSTFGCFLKPAFVCHPSPSKLMHPLMYARTSGVLGCPWTVSRWLASVLYFHWGMLFAWCLPPSVHFVILLHWVNYGHSCWPSTCCSVRGLGLGFLLDCSHYALPSVMLQLLHVVIDQSLSFNFLKWDEHQMHWSKPMNSMILVTWYFHQYRLPPPSCNESNSLLKTYPIPKLKSNTINFL